MWISGSTRLSFCEACEALEAAERIVGGMSLEDFMRSPEARFALRYALILFVESVVDAIVLALESVYGVAPES